MAVPNNRQEIPSDSVLRELIESLNNHQRYARIIREYFRETNEAERSGLEWRYERVHRSVSELWLSSDKNPSLFNDAKDFEPILRKRDLPYRDHFIHSYNVFLMGYYLANKLDELYSDRSYFGKNDWNLTWMLTSTFHDIGYPVQETEIWLSKFLEDFLGVNPSFSFNIAQIMPSIYNDFMHMLSRQHRYPRQISGREDQLSSIDWEFYNELNSGLMKKNHGVIGALMLCHRMAIKEGFLREPQTQVDMARGRNFMFIHLPAAHAISLHHLKSIPVSFSKYPFAYMLILTDELQDWGRPSNRSEQDVVQIKKITVDKNLVPRIKFEIEASPDREKTLEAVLKERLVDDGSIKIEIGN